MSDFIPYPFYHDDVPIDISFVFESEKPAGKHGFLKVDGKDFRFEDGTKARFWGTNFNGWACFPEHDYAEKLAKRLARIGINLVRFHQLDAEWHVKTMFAFSKGKRVTGGKLDPDSMELLDYLIYCLKKEGIYCYMDMYTYRKFKSDEGVENAQALGDAAKPICIFSDRLIALQKELCRELWTHYNPYTKLAYCDDPVFVMAEVANECDMFAKKLTNFPEPYHTEYLTKLDRWLSEHGIGKTAADFDLADAKNDTLVAFNTDLQENYYRQMYGEMRKAGVKIPITGNNWTSSPANLKAQLVTDYFDSHAYHYDWRWGEFEKHCANTSITGVGNQDPSFLAACAPCAVEDRPTFISEWDMPWPNDYRAESPIYCAAYGLLQGWSGFAIHTYSYTPRLDRMDRIGCEITSQKIGGIPYRQGVFSAWNDPAKFGLFYHSALITRRGDVRRAENVLKIAPLSRSEFDKAPINAAFEKSAIVSDLSFRETKTEPTAAAMESEIVSDTGELLIDRKKNYGLVKTDMTKCAYGFLAKNGPLDLNGLRVTCDNDFAVIAMSSLTDEAIGHSDNILLTTVGRARNHNTKRVNDLTLDVGEAPIEVEVIRAELELETDVDGLTVWAISPEGFNIGRVPTTYENGKLRFTVGNESQSMYYLIVKE